MCGQLMIDVMFVVMIVAVIMPVSAWNKMHMAPGRAAIDIKKPHQHQQPATQ